MNIKISATNETNSPVILAFTGLVFSMQSHDKHFIVLLR